jgi:hypothetical protein
MIRIFFIFFNHLGDKRFKYRSKKNKKTSLETPEKLKKFYEKIQ